MVILTGRDNLLKYCAQHGIQLEDFNEDIEIVEGCTDLTSLLEGCESFNSNVYIPDTVHILKRFLKDCPNFDKHILLPAEALDCSEMFKGCFGFNKPVRLPPTLRNANQMFYDCVSLEQPLKIPKGIVAYSGMLYNTAVTPSYEKSEYIYERLFEEVTDNKEYDNDLETVDMYQPISIDTLRSKSKSAKRQRTHKLSNIS